MASAVCGCLGILVFLLGSLPAFSQDFLMAKVLAVDTEKMEIQVLCQAAKKSLATGSNEEKLLVRIAAENDLPRVSGVVVFPGCVVSGKTIRLWGETALHGGNVFFATDIRGCRDGRCSDPTGVRLRLLRSRMNNQLGTNDGFVPSPDSNGIEGGGFYGGGGNGGGGGGGSGGGGGGGGGGGR